MTRAALADAIRPFAPGGRLRASDVPLIDALADAFGIPADGLTARRTSAKGLALIKSFEGLRLDAYPDPATGGDPWTIGYGHTSGVKRGDRITEQKADEFLRADLRRFEAAVSRLTPQTTQGQFDALVSFAFNVGEGALERSTLRKLHNAGKYDAASREFGKWANAAGRRMAGLVRRRSAESDMYQS